MEGKERKGKVEVSGGEKGRRKILREGCGSWTAEHEFRRVSKFYDSNTRFEKLSLQVVSNGCSRAVGMSVSLSVSRVALALHWTAQLSSRLALLFASCSLAADSDQSREERKEMG